MSVHLRKRSARLPTHGCATASDPKLLDGGGVYFGMAYRDDVAALAARHEALTDEVQRKTRELGETSRMLDEVRRRASLPILDNIRVATPCKASWDDMVGDERVRFCKQCSKNVFNLSAMTRDEVHQLIARTEDELCGRYFQRADGTIMTADCTVGVRRRRRIVAVAAGVLAAAAAVVTYKVAKKRHHATEVIPPAEVTMGKIDQLDRTQAPPASVRPTHAGANSDHDVP
jgi:hypothetical protein